MAERKATVDIDIKGLNSIQQLEDYLTEVNGELKNLDVNSDAFKDLSNKAAAADGKLRDVNTRLEGVTSTEKAEGILKLGEGFAGAFAAVQGLGLALGKNNEEFEKVIAQVGGLILALDGVRKVTEAFSAENIKRLRGVGRSFKTLTATVKVSASAMRTALIATGIGALVVAVGLLIANWDKLTNLVNTKKREKQLKRELDILNQQNIALEKYNEAINSEADLLEQIAEYNEDFAIAAKARQSAAEAEIPLLQNRYKILKASLELEENALEKLIKQNGKKKKGYEEQLEKVEEIRKELQSIDEQFALALYKQQRITAEAKAFSEVYAAGEAEKALTNQQKILAAQEYTTAQIYNNNLKILDLRIQQIEAVEKYGGKLTKSEKDQLATLKTEREVLKLNEQERRNNLELELERIQAQRKYNEELAEAISYVDENTVRINDQLLLDQALVDIANSKVHSLERELEIDQYRTEEAMKLIPFDQKGLEILRERFGLKQDEFKLDGEIAGLTEKSADLFIKQKIEIATKLEAMQKEAAIQKALLQFEIQRDEKLVEGIGNQIKMFEAIEAIAASRVSQLNVIRATLELDLAKAKNDEERLAILQKIDAVDSEIAAATTEEANAQKEIVTLQQERYQLETDITVKKQEQQDITDDLLEQQKRLNYEIEQAVRLSSQINYFLEEYNQELAYAGEAVMGLFELWAIQQDNLIKKLRRDAQDYQNEINDIEKAQEEAGEAGLDLEELLKDANGERFEELQYLIENAEQKQISVDQAAADRIKELEKLKAQAEFDAAKAEYKAEKRRKAAALVEAIVNGALAVVKALPNIILAALAGVAAGVQIAVIAAQKIPEPKAADFGLRKGGYTANVGEDEIAGVVHGGEYVVPAPVLSSEQGATLVSLLEGMRKGGFQDGGLTTPDTNISTNGFIDYDVLAEKVAQAVSNMPVIVELVPLSRELRNVNTVQTRAGIR